MTGMQIVTDSNILYDVLQKDDSSPYTELFLNNTIYAPGIILPETGNIIWKHIRFGGLDSATGHLYLSVAERLISTILPDSLLAENALELAVSHQVTFYDALYLAAAIYTEGKLATLDKKLLNAASRIGVGY